MNCYRIQFRLICTCLTLAMAQLSSEETNKANRFNEVMPSAKSAKNDPLVYELPPLPYAFDALEPVISAEIMKLHYSKHHQAYVNNLNKALKEFAEAEKKQKTAISKFLDFEIFPSNIFFDRFFCDQYFYNFVLQQF